MSDGIKTAACCPTCREDVDTVQLYGAWWRCETCRITFERGAAYVPRPPSIRARTLDAARSAVLQDRSATHGAPEDSFAALARIWSARLGIPLTPAQACLLLVDLKTVRAWSNPAHEDNWIDIAGYAACGAEVATG